MYAKWNDMCEIPENTGFWKWHKKRCMWSKILSKELAPYFSFKMENHMINDCDDSKVARTSKLKLDYRHLAEVQWSKATWNFQLDSVFTVWDPKQRKSFNQITRSA